MRIATITSWAYNATVCLTITSGAVILTTSSADNTECQVVEQCYQLDQLTEEVELGAWSLSDLAYDYVIAKGPEVLNAYRQKEATLKAVEHRLPKLKDPGAAGEELALLHEGSQIADALQDEQAAVFASVARAEESQAIALPCGKSYEQELEHTQDRIDYFRQLLDNCVRNITGDATQSSRMLRTASEVMVDLTALLLLFVFGFILKRRVPRSVVRLSDVVNRLASQDYAVEMSSFSQIDEIGDMAQVIRIFRENGLARQRLEKERDADWVIRDLPARMAQRLQGCEDFVDVINVAKLFAPNIAPGIAGRLYILDQEPWQMRCVAQWLPPQGKADAFHPDECWAMRRGQSHPPAQGEPDIVCYHLPESCQHRTLRTPLIAQGETIDLLLFQNLSGDSVPSRVYLELMAEALSLTLASQCLRDILSEEAFYDLLTGLRNRHHLGDTLRTQMSQVVCNKEPISCLMIDIDHLKGINGHFGHEAGNNVIKSTVATIQRVAHDGGMAFRYGGGELLVLLPNMDEQAASRFAMEIYNGARELSLRFGVSDVGYVDVSIGVANYPQHAQSDDLLRTADVAPYHVKELGRPRIASFGTLEAS